ANLRSDASSRFGRNNRWATFPSLGLAWRISNEEFLKDRWSSVNEILLKSSIGWSGNQGIPDFASLGLWTGGNNYLGQPGVSPSQLGNEDLKWETTRQWNIGLEGSFFNRRFTVGLDIYDKYTTDLLDRKSTRLNSSHVKISYAVFCLKKKKKQSHS